MKLCVRIIAAATIRYIFCSLFFYNLLKFTQTDIFHCIRLHFTDGCSAHCRSDKLANNCQNAEERYWLPEEVNLFGRIKTYPLQMFFVYHLELKNYICVTGEPRFIIICRKIVKTDNKMFSNFWFWISSSKVKVYKLPHGESCKLSIVCILCANIPNLDGICKNKRKFSKYYYSKFHQSFSHNYC